MTTQLTKGQRINLQEQFPEVANEIFMGLGWELKNSQEFVSSSAADKQAAPHLEASCLLLDEYYELIETVWFKHQEAAEGSVIYESQPSHGQENEDAKLIHLHLADIPDTIHSVVLVLNSFTGQKTDEIERAYCRLVDISSQKELARYELHPHASFTGQIMVRLYRDGKDWTLQTIGEPADGKTFQELLSPLRRALAH